MTAVRAAGSVVATTAQGPVAYDPSARVPADGARDIHEEKV